MEAKLWGGFSAYAVQDLERLKLSPRAEPEESHRAAWALAQWYKDKGDYQRAYDNLAQMVRLEPRRTVKQLLLEAEFLIQSNHRDNALALLNEGLRRDPTDARLYLAMANCHTPPLTGGDTQSDAIRLGWVNKLYDADQLQRLAKMDEARPLGIDNLIGMPIATKRCQPKVSVIMPVYRAEETLNFALRSVLGQTWEEIEVIVVDDCSPDNSFLIAEELSRNDSRILVVRQDQNQGTYVARNRGLKLATGEYVTTHDADDWAHPQRIEIQMRQALGASNFVGNLVRRAHVQQDLRFTSAGPLGWARCSFLTKRETIQSLGGWDRVRISADTEFMWRAEKFVSGGRIERVISQAPLLLQLTEGPSLTRSDTTSVRTIHYGVRREYREAAKHWHAMVQSRDHLSLCDDRRPFPAPGLILPNRETHVSADLLFIADFNLDDNAAAAVLRYVHAAIHCGQTIALFHWSHYHGDVAAPLRAEVRQMAHEHKVRIVAPGERVRASMAIVGTPTVLEHVVDLSPQVEAGVFVILVTQAFVIASSRLRNPKQIRENIRRLFGTDGLWIPCAEWIRRLMLDDPLYPTPHSETWLPLVDADYDQLKKRLEALSIPQISRVPKS